MNDSDNVVSIFKYSEEEFTLEEQYRLALESVFRWTLKRDELRDADIVRAIKQVAMVALEDNNGF